MRALEIATRAVGAGLLAATAGIHLHLWRIGYSDIPTIGTLFMALVVTAALLAAAVLLSPGRLWPIATALGAGLELATVLGLAVTVEHGLFGFQDTSASPAFWQSVAVEIAGTLVLGAATIGGIVRSRSRER